MQPGCKKESLAKVIYEKDSENMPEAAYPAEFPVITGNNWQPPSETSPAEVSSQGKPMLRSVHRLTFLVFLVCVFVSCLSAQVNAWVPCGNEGGTCVIPPDSGRLLVRFGAEQQFAVLELRSVTNIPCNSSVTVRGCQVHHHQGGTRERR
jgi:hypothetical protein